MDIKNLKPSKNSRFKQGYFRPRNPEKYLGDITKIIFRSSWETRFMQWCDMNANVVEWSSEPVQILYINPIKQHFAKLKGKADPKPSNYYVDFFMKVKNGEEITCWLVEVKPNSQFHKPDASLLEGNKTLAKVKSYNWQLKTFLVNKAKFIAAKQFAESRGWKFAICDEKFLF